MVIGSVNHPNVCRPVKLEHVSISLRVMKGNFNINRLKEPATKSYIDEIFWTATL